MSYILDALKRADAERERGHVPGLHAQPAAEAGAEPSSRAPRWALWAGFAVGAVVLAALAWRMGADSNAPLPMPAPTPAPASPAVAAVSVETAPVATVPSYAPPPVPAAPRIVKEPRVNPAAIKGPASAPAVIPSSPVQAPPVGPAVPAAPIAAAQPTQPAQARIPLISELPAAVRRQLPTLSVGGSVYSDDATARFILLNGEVAKEGSQPAPGLMVERIEPKSAVLRFKGEQFRLPF